LILSLAKLSYAEAAEQTFQTAESALKTAQQGFCTDTKDDHQGKGDSEPGVSPNLNVGRVPDPDSELLKKAQMVREKALSDGETHILLGTIFGG